MPNSLEALVGQMTLAELASKSGRTLDQLVSFAMNAGAPSQQRASAPARAPAKAATPSRPTNGREINTRSQAGREAYERAVFEVIASANGKVAATDIRSKVGGTPMQARAALNRLIEDGKVAYSGVARGTRYSLA